MFNVEGLKFFPSADKLRCNAKALGVHRELLTLRS